MTKYSDPFFDGNRHLLALPDSTLRDLARNECTTRDYKKFAVELLLSRKSPYAQHEDLRELVQELEVELDGIQFEFPAPSDERPETNSAPSASFTTKSMFGDEEPIDNTEHPAARKPTREKKPKPPVKEEPDAP